jgi:uncharacterized protein (TIGR01777 family)
MNIVRKIILAGGTGFIGQLLINHWQNQAVDIVVLSRKPCPDHDRVRYVAWDGETFGAWTTELNGADVLINLSGKSVDCRYTEENKRLILESRTQSTTVLGEAIERAANPPGLWINLASATVYRHSLDLTMDESTGETGSPQPSYRFSEQVCQAWEQALWDASTPHTRKVALRTSLVLGREGGVFPVLRRLVRLGMGGQQFVSWIHATDFVRIIDFIIATNAVSGVVNATVPNPIRNDDFMTLLRQALHAPVGLPATAWMLEIGAVLLRTETELVLKSRNVVPTKLLDAGFQFDFPTADKAVSALASS